MARIVILGAGPTGLSAAYHLEQAGFHDYVLFEKEATTGGLCRSIKKDGFTFDYTGHLLHINNPYFKSLINTLMDPTDLCIVERKSYVYSQDTYTPYPYQMNLHGLPIRTITECIEGYILREKSSKENESFYDWVMHHFGTGFAKHFFIPYQSKIFAYDIHQISGSWTGRFVPSTSLEDIIQGAIGHAQTVSVGYNAQFFYPTKGGIQFWVDKLAEKITHPIRTGYAVNQIDAQNKIVHFTNGHQEPYTYLINTIPLDIFLEQLKEPSSSNVRQSKDKLLCNSVLNFNLGIKSYETDKHWIYFPETRYLFYRLGFTHNFSPYAAPAGHSSLYGELAYMHLSSEEKLALSKQAIEQTKAVLQIADTDIVMQELVDIKHAYVLYTFWREKNLPTLLQHLQDLDIHSTGRYGGWKYSSMQEAVLDGKEAAEKALMQTEQFLPNTSYVNNVLSQ